MDKKRQLFFYKDYFREFYDSQTWKVQKKILWTLEIVETLDRIPEIYLKHLENTDGLYEIRVQVGNNIYRMFCFFDNNDLVLWDTVFKRKHKRHQRLNLTEQKKLKAVL